VAEPLAGRVAVVIGGTSGIGRVLALGLAEAGADVVPSSRRAERVEAAAREIEERGRRSLSVASDVTDRRSLEALRDRALEAFGRVDILVYCAGKTRRVPTLEMTEAEWQDVMETNLTGAFRAGQIFGRHMVERGYGRIINIASVASSVALYEVAAYNASKAALVALTRSLAVEWAPHGVCVNAIAPGFFVTDLNRHILEGTPRGAEILLRTPMKRFGRLEELKGAAVFLASEAASFVTGEVLTVDGGFLASGVNQ